MNCGNTRAPTLRQHPASDTAATPGLRDWQHPGSDTAAARGSGSVPSTLMRPNTRPSSWIRPH